MINKNIDDIQQHIIDAIHFHMLTNAEAAALLFSVAYNVYNMPHNVARLEPAGFDVERLADLDALAELMKLHAREYVKSESRGA